MSFFYEDILRTEALENRLNQTGWNIIKETRDHEPHLETYSCVSSA